MAFAQPVKIGQENTTIYNLEQAVGVNAPNARGDVRLVQFMLRGLYGTKAGNLKVDGWAGPITNSWIKRFQLDVRAVGNKVLADGRLDRALGYKSSVSKTVYGIILMNLNLRQSNPALFAAIPTAVEINKKPKANPYNQAKGPKVTFGYPWQMMKITGDHMVVIYEDGSKEDFIVKGQNTWYGVPLRDGLYVQGPDGKPLRIDNPVVIFD